MTRWTRKNSAPGSDSTLCAQWFFERKLKETELANQRATSSSSHSPYRLATQVRARARTARWKAPRARTNVMRSTSSTFRALRQCSEFQAKAAIASRSQPRARAIARMKKTQIAAPFRERAVARARDARPRAVACDFVTLPKTRAQTNARTRERERRHALARAMLLRATSPRGQRKIRGTSSRVLRIG